MKYDNETYTLCEQRIYKEKEEWCEKILPSLSKKRERERERERGRECVANMTMKLTNCEKNKEFTRQEERCESKFFRH
jgi:hypothetical protein